MRARLARLALTRRAFRRRARVRTIAFAYLFAGVRLHPAGRLPPRLPDAAEPARRSPTASPATRRCACSTASRTTCSRVGGYTAWRVGGTLAIFAARLRPARRGAGAAHRGGQPAAWSWCSRARSAGAAAYLGVAGGDRRRRRVLWARRVRSAVAGRWLPVGGSAYLALATVSVVPVFAGVGALASQLAPTRRIALELASGARRGSLFLLRVVADTASGAAAGCAGSTPLGWAEELRPFAGAAAARAAAARSATGAAAARARGRGSRGGATSAPACCPRASAAEPRLRLLSSPTAQALREERGEPDRRGCSAVGAFAFILGVISKSISSAGISDEPAARAREARRRLDRDPEPATSPSCFIFFVLAVSLFACAQIGAARARGGRRAARDAARAAGRPRALARRAAALAARRRRRSRSSRGLLAWVGAARPGRQASRCRRCSRPARTACPSALLFLGIARARLRARPARERRDRLRAGHRRVPLAARRLRCSARRTGCRPDAVRSTSGSCRRSRSGRAPPPR